MSELQTAARALAERLEQSNSRVVFAESCTGGLVAASLAGVPGISRFLCGSFVVYRNASKTAWLRVDEKLIDEPGPVSAEVAEALASGALDLTPEADVAVTVTGHLGPGAEAGLDGVCFVGWQQRGAEPASVRLTLRAEGRVARQQEAAVAVLTRAFEIVG